MYIMCVCLFSALSRRVGALQISIIIIIVIICRLMRVSVLTNTTWPFKSSQLIGIAGNYRQQVNCQIHSSLFSIVMPRKLCFLGALRPRRRDGLLGTGTEWEGDDRVRLDRGNRPKKTGETVVRRQNNGSVKAVSPRHCPATCALRNCCFNCCAWPESQRQCPLHCC